MKWIPIVLIAAVFMLSLAFICKEDFRAFLCKKFGIHTWKEVRVVGPSGTVIEKKICCYCGKEKKS